MQPGIGRAFFEASISSDMLREQSRLSGIAEDGGLSHPIPLNLYALTDLPRRA